MEAREEQVTSSLTEESDSLDLRESVNSMRRRIFMQFLLVFGASLGHIGVAVVASWPNPAIPELQSNKTDIFGNYITLNPWQLDMLGSMVSIGNLPGTWLWGWMVAVLGRKRSIMLLLVPYTIGWGLVAFSSNAIIMLSGRLIHGICVGATFVSASTYIIELPDASVRGAMALIPNFMLSLGFILTSGLGLSLRWYEIAFVGESIAIMFWIIMVFLPESPSFLAIKGSEEEALSVLRRLRGQWVNLAEEMQSLRNQNEDKLQKPLYATLRDSDILKSLVIIIVLFFIQNFCGLMVFYVNMTRIFLEAGSTLNEYVSTVLVFLVQAAGNLLACLYLDRLGRKPCLIFSLVIMTVCLVVMAIYHHLKDLQESVITEVFNNSTEFPTVGTLTVRTDGMKAWVPLLCLMVYMFVSSIGAGPVPSLLNSEYFPTAVRSQLSGLCMAIGGVFNFAALQLFSPLHEMLTIAGLFWFYASVSIMGVVFTLLCVRETKGVAVG
ncbi:hypothetical protein SK128_014978 [Halocaridina rubra]|uniref:Major facilitator superfamily (MFS) profile domain-containing protein n=1 Tax=Halocaridina rubra TaxID=373956 RepID=A0AAN9AAK4_HALRR